MTSYSLFAAHPGVQPTWGDTGAVTLATQFSATAPAWLTALRYPHPAAATEFARRTAALYSVSPSGDFGAMVAGPFTMPDPVAGEWCTVQLPEPLALVPGTSYRAAILHPGGLYPATGGYFKDGPGSADQDFGPLHLPSADHVAYNRQGSFQYGPSIQFTDSSFNGASYFSDVVVSDTDPAVVPAASTVTGADGTAYQAYRLTAGALVHLTPTP